MTDPIVDDALLRGFSFGCRPDCGLCCYAEPLVAPSERAGLLQIAPNALFVSRGRNTLLAAHPDGGACTLLQGNRCSAHASRPAPCREYPLAAHVGARIQATVVLSCPGIDLAVLDSFRAGDRLPAPLGLDGEWESLTRRAAANGPRLLDTCQRRARSAERRLRSDGRWDDVEEVRARLSAEPPMPFPEEFPAEELPEAEAGLALLPIFFDHRPGPVAIARVGDGEELLELRPSGGVVRSLGVVPSLRQRPQLSDDATRTLHGYLRYWLQRDALHSRVLRSMMSRPEGTLAEWFGAELRDAAAVVLSRAHSVAAARRGAVERMTVDDLRQGIRAADQDLLDQPTLGSPL